MILFLQICIASIVIEKLRPGIDTKITDDTTFKHVVKKLKGWMKRDDGTNNENGQKM
jgi:hypothetical protein